ncbi:MAG: arginyltransferase [Phycisphaerae bacterium]
MKSDAHDCTQRIVDDFLAAKNLPAGAEHPCPYLPDRVSVNQGFVIDRLGPNIYRALMDRGFRRSGQVIYRPACHGCRMCRQIRVPVNDFAPSRSQRRIWRRNHDISVNIATPIEPSTKKWELFRSYVEQQHDNTMSTDYDDFVSFLYTSPTESVEFSYRVGVRLIGVSIADLCPDAVSSVYMFFDPACRQRSLGTFSILWEIDYCRRHDMSYYYLGFHVAGSRTMAYKARFKPCETLDDAFVWHRIEE